MCKYCQCEKCKTEELEQVEQLETIEEIEPTGLQFYKIYIKSDISKIYVSSTNAKDLYKHMF